MQIDFTPWLWVNWFLVAFIVGAGWSLGCWLMGLLLGALRRTPAA